jgi:hypothetical protein
MGLLDTLVRFLQSVKDCEVRSLQDEPGFVVFWGQQAYRITVERL